MGGCIIRIREMSITSTQQRSSEIQHASSQKRFGTSNILGKSDESKRREIAEALAAELLLDIKT
jgi:hypothetical protein